MGGVIRTGVDRLVELVQEKKRISVADAAKEMGVSPAVVEEWMDFLEEEGLIGVEYHFTKPYLVEKRLSAGELQQKAKELKNEKEAFIRKAESTISVLEREGEALKKLKKSVGKLKGAGFRSHALALEKGDSRKRETSQEAKKHEQAFRKHLEAMEREITREQEKYNLLLGSVQKEEGRLEREIALTLTLEERERGVRERLERLRKDMRELQKLSKKELEEMGMTERRLAEFRKRAEEMEKKVERKKERAVELLEKKSLHGRKSGELEGNLLGLLKEGERISTEGLRKLIIKRREILDLLEQIESRKGEMERELETLIKKAKAYSPAPGGASVKEQLKGLESAFEGVKRKKEALEREALRLRSMFT